MSFSQLLALGRSFAGVPTEPSRYKVAEGQALPKFQTRGWPLRNSGARNSADGMMNEKRAERKTDQQQLEQGRGSRGARRWGGFFRTPDKTGEGRGARRLVQGELSLESVQVLRNDLRDADWEIVPVGTGRADGSRSRAAEERGVRASRALQWLNGAFRRLRDAGA